jgi:hypothetical protein
LAVKNIKQADGRPALTTTPVTAPPATTVQLGNPEVYRLPKQGQRDPYHGMSRSWYYGAEKAGQLKLIRLRKRGNIRGVTLVPFAAVADMIRRAAEDPSIGDAPPWQCASANTTGIKPDCK